MSNSEPNKELQEGLDFYWEGSYMVLTEHFLLNRGYCCKNQCRHCPWGYKDEIKAQNLYKND